MVDAIFPDQIANADSHAEQSATLVPLSTFRCTACQIVFPNGQEQRAHMKESWHVYNIKRRLEGLPAVSLETYRLENERHIDTRPARAASRSSHEDVSDSESEQSASPFHCLFCSQDFANDDVGFAENLDHMRLAHGLFIPESERVADMQTFVGYLATEVRIWHECLYCGATKPSTEGIQSHMRDKGHCHLNLDREPELLDFWESPRGSVEGENDEVMPAEDLPTSLSATELRFASGRVVGSRHMPTVNKRATRKRELAASTRKALPSGSEDENTSPPVIEPQPAVGKQLMRRQEMSLQGVSTQQRQALVLAEKKAQRSEAAAHRAREWIYAKAANAQEYDQLDNQMKWGKKNHKLLPR